jgi:hypothetical protein
MPTVFTACLLESNASAVSWRAFPIHPPIHSSTHPLPIIVVNLSKRWLASWGPGDASG